MVAIGFLVPLYLQHRGACDHAEPIGPQPAQTRDDLLVQPVDEVLLFRVSSQVFERKGAEHDPAGRRDDSPSAGQPSDVADGE